MKKKRELVDCLARMLFLFFVVLVSVEWIRVKITESESKINQISPIFVVEQDFPTTTNELTVNQTGELAVPLCVKRKGAVKICRQFYNMHGHIFWRKLKIR